MVDGAREAVTTSGSISISLAAWPATRPAAITEAIASRLAFHPRISRCAGAATALPGVDSRAVRAGAGGAWRPGDRRPTATSARVVARNSSRSWRWPATIPALQARRPRTRGGLHRQPDVAAWHAGARGPAGRRRIGRRDALRPVHGAAREGQRPARGVLPLLRRAAVVPRSRRSCSGRCGSPFRRRCAPRTPGTLIAGLLGQPHSRDAAWAFVQAQWPTLTQKLGTFQGIPDIIGALGSFCSRGGSRRR